MTDAPIPLEVLVDPRVGIVKSCVRLPRDHGEPARPIIYAATLSSFDYRPSNVAERLGSGKGLSEEIAFRGAVVEALERYCAGQWHVDSLVDGPAAALDAPAIPPEDFVLYSERQYDRPGFPYRKPTAADPLTWVRGRFAADDSPVYLPAAFVYLGVADDGLASASSNGLAGGADIHSAVLAGLYELIERDAFLITWLARLPAARIDFGDREPAAGIRRHYERHGVETVAFDLTNDLAVPVVLAMAIDRSGRLPAASIGLGCGLQAEDALDRAFMELVQGRAGVAAHYRRHPPRLRSYEDVRTMEDHAALAALPVSLPELGFLLERDDCIRLNQMTSRGSGDVEGDLKRVRTSLERAGCTVAYVDLTQPDIEPFGVRIVRTVATGLQPMHFGFGEERLGGRRLFELPRLLGHEAADLTEHDLNPCPHPLA